MSGKKKRFPRNFEEAYALLQVSRQRFTEGWSHCPLWLRPMIMSVARPELTQVLKALRTITAEWQKDHDRDESVREWEFPLIATLWHLEIPAERKGEVVETVMEFVAYSDDTIAAKFARRFVGLPERRWAAIGMAQAARDVLADIEREFGSDEEQGTE